MTSPAAPLHSELANVALEKPVSATSVGFWRTPASSVTDGDRQSFWRPSGGDPLPLYVEVDLEGTFEVERIHVVEVPRAGNFRLTGYGLYGSVDRQLWTRLDAGRTIGVGRSVEVGGEPLRFVRLVIKETDGLDVPSISSIEVYAPPLRIGQRARRIRQEAPVQFEYFRIPSLDAEGVGERSRWPERAVIEETPGAFRMLEVFDQRVSLIAPAGKDLSQLVPEFRLNRGEAFVGDDIQISGFSSQSFDEPVTYMLSSQDEVDSRFTVTVYPDPAPAHIAVYPRQRGVSMPLVGYSAMNLTKGDNLASWYAYSGVNSVRYWLTPGRQVGAGAVRQLPDMESAGDFRATREDLRSRMQVHPTDSTWIDWEEVNSRNHELIHEGRRLTAHYALSQLRESGITLMAALNDSQWSPPWESEAEMWQRAWLLWQMFYAQAYYLAQNFSVEYFQGPNEPDLHMGRYSDTPEDRAMAVERFVFMNAVYTDAVRAAVDDFNRFHGTELNVKWGAPTLASRASSDIGVATLKHNRRGIFGETLDHNVNDLFILQRYAGSPDAFRSSNAIAREQMDLYLPVEGWLPVLYTEFNHMPGSVWRNLTRTSDHAEIFRNMASVWSGSMLDGTYGKWQFRIARPVAHAGNHVHHMFHTPRDPARNLLWGQSYSVSSELPDFPLQQVLLNTAAKNFAWKTDPSKPGPHEAVWEFSEPQTVGGYVLNFQGGGEGPRQGTLQYWDASRSAWVDFEGAAFRNPSRQQYMADSRAVESLNAHLPIASQSNVLLKRALRTPVETTRIRFFSPDPGQIVVNRIYLMEEVTDGDIGGPMKSAEVTRLFARNFAGSRPLLNIRSHALHDPGFEPVAVAHPDRWVVWIPQTSDRVGYSIDFDFTELGDLSQSLLSIREVSATRFGEVIHLQPAGERTPAHLIQPSQSLWVATVDRAVNLSPEQHRPKAVARVGLGVRGDVALPLQWPVTIRQKTAHADEDEAIYFNFDVPVEERARIARATIRVNGQWVSEALEAMPEDERFPLFLFAVAGQTETVDGLTGHTAPGLARGDIGMTGPLVQPVGVLTFGPDAEDVWVDVTEWIQSSGDPLLTLVLLRQRRHEDEIADTEKVWLREPPLLETWRSLD